ncbi:unnamed protein product [Citrullus colocynthis]|uniref:Uncharacterized protein n=1 Tax=Citrullus colocynthis TaxID=252529 RepID=A0ABP0Y9A7_9ROSI
MKSPSSHEFWHPPTKSWKMNSNASWSEELVVVHWKIKVLEMKAIGEGLKALRSQFEIVILPFLVESDYAEAIASLYEIESDLSDIKSVACSVLKLVEDFENIHFSKFGSSMSTSRPFALHTTINTAISILKPLHVQLPLSTLQIWKIRLNVLKLNVGHNCIGLDLWIRNELEELNFVYRSCLRTLPLFD